MTTVMVFGSFDVLHPGHLNFLGQAKSYGDNLVIVLARDAVIERIKGKKPKYNERERKEHLRYMGINDKIVFGYEEDPYEIIEEINPDIVCLGYDQEAFTSGLKEELEKRGLKTKIFRLNPYKEYMYKSSKLK